MACRIKTSTSSDHATFEDVRSAMHSKTAMMEAGGGKCIHRVNKICASRPYVCCAERFRASRASRVGSSVSARWRGLHPIPGSPPTAIIPQYSLRLLKIVRDCSNWSLSRWCGSWDPPSGVLQTRGGLLTMCLRLALQLGAVPFGTPCHLESGKFQKTDSTCQFQGALTGLCWTVSGQQITASRHGR